MRGLWVLLLSLWLPAWAQQPVPDLSGRVIDQIALLSESQRSMLDAKLAAFEQQAGSQIVILLVASSQPEDIAAFAQRIGDSWKIGRREVGDGLLIVVAKDDRQVRIEVAKALEGALPDLAAQQIIRKTITPAFKAGDYAGGLALAIDQLQARILGEGLPEPGRRGTGQQSLDFQQLGTLLFIGVPVLGALLTGIFGRKLGSALTGGAMGAAGWFVSGSLVIAVLAALGSLLMVGLLGVGSARSGRGWPGLGGGGGGGGGGFSSGRGGDFGGGGASGRW